MKSSFFVGLVEVLVVNLTLLSSRCCGMPTQILSQGSDIHSRLSRSVHAIRARLCPEGTSSKHCFYSQLSMFMQMHEPLRDLATSRTIGKRSMADLDYDSTPNLLQNSQSNEQGDDGLALLREFLEDDADGQDDVFDPNSPDDASDYDIVNTNRVFDPADDEMKNSIPSSFSNFGTHTGSLNQYFLERLNDFIQDNVQTTDIVNEQMNDDLNVNSNDKMQYVPLQKRQIVCPPGKTKLSCYNDAFAYYMRLLNIVENH